MTNSKIKKIDAKGLKIGRLATKVAIILMGKDDASFEKNIVSDTKVQIENVSELNISDKKKKSKIYTTFSLYPGGLKKKSLENIIAKKGNAEALRIAVKGMLPKNKLRDQRMKNLIIL